MSDLRKAAQQALEALEFDGFTPDDPTHRDYTTKAITALRTALAEPEQKPVAWMHTNGVGHVYFRKKPQDKVFNPRPVYLHPKTLTDEDISVLWHQSGEQPFKFARMLLR